MSELWLDSFGVRAHVSVGDPSLVEAVEARLPPGWVPAPSLDALVSLTVEPAGENTYAVSLDGGHPITVEGAKRAVDTLEGKLRLAVAEHAPAFAFVHAGVVAVDGRAVLIPGRSYAGKTTLVEALLRAGATYYSDEYAALDSDGLVHPFAKPLSIRPRGATRAAQPVETLELPAAELGAPTGTEPVPVGMVAVATYREGETWDPEERTPAETALALLQNAVAARTHSARVVSFIRQAVEGVRALEGERGEADETAAALLGALRS